MLSPGGLFGYGTLCFISLLAGIFAYRVLIGRISLKGLLLDKKTGAFSPERLQLLFVTLAGAGYYLVQGFTRGTNEMPEVPSMLLVGVGSSNAVYLTGKLFSHLRTK